MASLEKITGFVGNNIKGLIAIAGITTLGIATINYSNDQNYEMAKISSIGTAIIACAYCKGKKS